jgi:hypothetical protein
VVGTVVVVVVVEVVAVVVATAPVKAIKKGSINLAFVTYKGIYRRYSSPSFLQLLNCWCKRHHWQLVQWRTMVCHHHQQSYKFQQSMLHPEKDLFFFPRKM